MRWVRQVKAPGDAEVVVSGGADAPRVILNSPLTLSRKAEEGNGNPRVRSGRVELPQS